MEQASNESLRDLGARIIDLCGRMHGAECQLLELIRQLDERHPWDGAMLVQALNRALEWMDQEAREADGVEGASAEARGGCGEASGDAAAESSWQRAAADAGTVRATAAKAERLSLAARRGDALGLLAERFLAVAPE